MVEHDDPDSVRDPTADPPDPSRPQQPPSAEETTRSVHGASEAPQHIGPYRLLERIENKIYRLARRMTMIRRTIRRAGGRRERAGR